MDTLRIVQGDSPTSFGTKFFSGENEIKSVAKVVVTFEPNNFVMAEVTMVMSDSEILAHPFLSLESLKAAAAMRGLALVTQQEIGARYETFRPGDARLEGGAQVVSANVGPNGE